MVVMVVVVPRLLPVAVLWLQCQCERKEKSWRTVRVQAVVVVW